MQAYGCTDRQRANHGAASLGRRTDCRSAAASALHRTTSKRNDLVREVVGWNGVLAGSFARAGQPAISRGLL
jgi:hypothetical protein